ncbi:MAG TPA: TolC family outer membrane protein [Gammaproteobacteria bacterium]|nr:TolC family outer membrane protein [Gammaproteobacteria bacterium]
MKKLLLTIIIFSLCCKAFASTDLLQVFRQALVSDPTYQQAISQRLSTREGVPINIAGLLPGITASLAAPNYLKYASSGPASGQLSGTQRGYNMNLSLTQTVFDFGKFAGLASANALAKGADATLSAATQNLMIRVSGAYFNILKDQDNLIYIQSTKTAYAKQLDQITQQYRVGLKTITDVYTARASYETSVANTIAAEAQLATDKENLRAITGQLYPALLRLRDDFPLITPQPANIEDWVTTAGKQNWSVKSAQYQAESYRDIIKQQFAGHLPSVNIQAGYEADYFAASGNTIFQTNGASNTHTSTASLNFNIPIFEGGLVVAETDQAKYNYQTALQQLEFQLRSTLTQTRQNYLNVVAGISKIAADKQSIKSNISSLSGMQAGYRVGTEILVNVLNQQQNVFEAQEQYAADRYAYVNNLLALKQAAGTLSEADLAAINMWLSDNAKMYGN